MRNPINQTLLQKKERKCFLLKEDPAGEFTRFKELQICTKFKCGKSRFGFLNWKNKYRFILKRVNFLRVFKSVGQRLGNLLKKACNTWKTSDYRLLSTRSRSRTGTVSTGVWDQRVYHSASWAFCFWIAVLQCCFQARSANRLKLRFTGGLNRAANVTVSPGIKKMPRIVCEPTEN